VTRSTRSRIVVVGDALLDRDVEGVVARLSPEAPVPIVDDPVVRSRPGGAALAALLAAADGDVTLVTALAGDEAGRQLRRHLEAGGVDVVDLGLDGQTAEKVRVRTGGRSLLRVDYGGRAGGGVGPVTAEVAHRLGAARAILVSDYGRGVVRADGMGEAIAGLAGRIPVVWDPHPLGPEPVAGAALVTPNEYEAAHFAPEIPGDGVGAAAARARSLARRWAAPVAVTLGGAGALLVADEGSPLLVPAPHTLEGDSCGAGDRLAGAATWALAAGRGLLDALAGGVRCASAYVAAGGAGRLARRGSGDTGDFGDTGETRDAGDTGAAGAGLDAFVLSERIRSRGGTLVAAGGCFDLLHAGHVAMLEAARSLGDALIVCLNSDQSVRRLKGLGRPLVDQHDRARVLGALACVDGVVVFDEETPCAVLARLRPHIFAKGRDYAGAALPEADVLRQWGGEVVLLPYLDGRSTSRMVCRIRRPASPPPILIDSPGP
jgi:D-beta-D-heptose 7-phosphate kinase / D-beta-D-heptose 1-phosphate adenosyltransferase